MDKQDNNLIPDYNLNIDKVHLDKLNEMIKTQKKIDEEINGEKDISTQNINNFHINKLNNRESMAPLGLTLIEKNTYDGTLPAWFTLPPNAVNPTISLGGGGGANSYEWFSSAGGGSAGETIWDFPLNIGDTIYSVVGGGGTGGTGIFGIMGNTGHNGGTTIVEGSANFPFGGLRSQGGRGGEGARTDRPGLGGAQSYSSPLHYAGQAGGKGGKGGIINTYPQNGLDFDNVKGGKAGISDTPEMFFIPGGGGGGASMIGPGGKGGNRSPAYTWGFSSGHPGIYGSGGGGGGSGSFETYNPIVGEIYQPSNGGNGGNGWVRVKYYI